MGKLGIIQDIKCWLGHHVKRAFNYYDRNTWDLYYVETCINCPGMTFNFVRHLTEEEKGLPIWEILGTTKETYYGDDWDALIPYLELP